MRINTSSFKQLIALQNPFGQQVQLIAVSKLKPAQDIQALYELGQREFGENYVQELVAKQAILPQDIHWHFLGHLQSNKVKFIAPFVHLIQGVDSLSLLKEINKQALKNNRVINCLLQVFIANEETKFGFNTAELHAIFNKEVLQNLNNIKIVGLMGMASYTSNKQQINQEFLQLYDLFSHYKQYAIFPNVSMLIASYGMSADYEIAIQNNSNMIRVGSLLFGERT